MVYLLTGLGHEANTRDGDEEPVFNLRPSNQRLYAAALYKLTGEADGSVSDRMRVQVVARQGGITCVVADFDEVIPREKALFFILQ